MSLLLQLAPTIAAAILTTFMITGLNLTALHVPVCEEESQSDDGSNDVITMETTPCEGDNCPDSGLTGTTIAATNTDGNDLVTMTTMTGTSASVSEQTGVTMNATTDSVSDAADPDGGATDATVTVDMRGCGHSSPPDATYPNSRYDPVRTTGSTSNPVSLCEATLHSMNLIRELHRYTDIMYDDALATFAEQIAVEEGDVEGRDFSGRLPDRTVYKVQRHEAVGNPLGLSSDLDIHVSLSYLMNIWYEDVRQCIETNAEVDDCMGQNSAIGLVWFGVTRVGCGMSKRVYLRGDQYIYETTLACVWDPYGHGFVSSHIGPATGPMPSLDELEPQGDCIDFSSQCEGMAYCSQIALNNNVRTILNVYCRHTCYCQYI